MAEVQEDLERGFYEKQDRDEAIAKLLTARIGLEENSPPYQEITRLLGDIESRYSD